MQEEMDYRGRQLRLAQALAQRGLHALLVTHLPNVRYLCGFTGSAGVLLVGQKATFFTDGRYREQARTEIHNARVVVSKGPLLEAVATALHMAKVKQVGVEAQHMTVATMRDLSHAFRNQGRLVQTRGMVEQQRVVKEPAEVERIRKAVLVGSSLFDSAVKAIHPGLPETAVAAELEYAARRAGADAMSFETIVASGPRSALPHGRASAQPIPARGFVVLDFGVILGGYCSDMTRTVYVGKPTAEGRGMYEAVREAQQAAVQAVRPGCTTGEVDRAARSSLRRSGLAKYFTHSTGHGVGLEIHEPPRVAARQQENLRPGMVITIEPGVYVPGVGGVRIEDMVVVTERGCEVLTPTTKELLAL